MIFLPKITKAIINNEIKTNPVNYVSECENRYFRSLENVVKRILSFENRCLVMLAGPSSSGKTTTAGIIMELIKAQGRNAIMVSLDDFYKEQSEAPKFEDGSPDFETVHALNVPQIVDCLHRLIDTGECSMPVFDFITKSPKQNAKHLKIGADDVVIVEGLHALNPLITEPLSDEDMLKLYVSVSSRIYNSEDKVEFTKRDIRFIRRMIRDYHFRGSSVEFTFYLWKGVRRGEDEYLFPFTENADVKIDSIHPYELCVYKEQAIKLLGHIEKDSEYYETARNYIERLSEMLNLSESYVPDTSLLHEFIG